MLKRKRAMGQRQQQAANKLRCRKRVLKHKLDNHSNQSSNSVDSRDSLVSPVTSPQLAHGDKGFAEKGTAPVGKGAGSALALSDSPDVVQMLARLQKSLTRTNDSKKYQSKKVSEKVTSLTEKVTSLQDQVASMQQTIERLAATTQQQSSLIASMLLLQYPQQQASLLKSFGSAGIEQSSEVLALAKASLSFHSPEYSGQDDVWSQVKAITTSQYSEVFKRYINDKKFWDYLSELYYVPMAIYALYLEAKQSKPSTIKNNLNSLRVLSKLFRKHNCPILEIAQLKEAPKFLSEEYIESAKSSYINEQATDNTFRMRSTLNGYLSTLTAMVRKVMGVSEFTATVAGKYFDSNKPIISKEDFLAIMNQYLESTDPLAKLIGFYLYLLFVTGERNETIRTVEFTQFIQDDATGKYLIQLYAAKTKKVTQFYLPKEAFDFVQQTKTLRLAEVDRNRQQLMVKQQLGNTAPGFVDKMTKLYTRRSLFLFTFFTQSAIHYHIKKLRNTPSFENLRYLAEFLIHNIRKLKIRAAFNDGGLQEAQRVANHSNPATTIRYYLDPAQLQQPIPWGKELQLAHPGLKSVQIRLSGDNDCGSDDDSDGDGDDGDENENNNHQKSDQDSEDNNNEDGSY